MAVAHKMKYILVVVAALAATGCSVTRHVPDGSYLLSKSTVVPDKETPKADRVTASDVERYIRQTPNNRFLGTNLYLGIYSLSNPDKNSWIHRSLRKIGAAPVILDTMLVKRSLNNLDNYLIDRGYYYSDNRYEITTKNKKAQVTYYIKQNEPYRLRNVSYEFRDKHLEPVISQYSSGTLLKSGDRFDNGVLRSEESRITSNLKDNGYYFFSPNNITIVADTMVGNYRTDLEFIIKQHLKGYDNMGAPIYEDNRVYRIDSIFVRPGYDPQKAASDPDYLRSMDTSAYRGLNILHHGKANVRRKILRHAINLQQNQLYSETDVRQAYSNIMRLGYYKNASIVFEDKTDYTQPNLVTFVGKDGQTSTVSEGYLSCYINCIPATKQSYQIEFEGTTSSNFYGINASIGYQNRNLFRGVEMLDITLRGGYEFMRSKQTNMDGSWEIGGAISLSFPRFITPVRIDRYNKMVNPRTKVEFSINSQNRQLYERTITGGTWSYTWSNKGASSFTLRPIDLNIIKMGKVDAAFLEDISKNPFLRNSYESQIIAGISGSYVYNSQLRQRSKNSWMIRTNWETAGNLINGLTHWLGDPSYDSENDRNYYKLFGIRYAQYFRIDFSFTDKVSLLPRTVIAYRLYAGGGTSYGNSTSIPFDRLFYSGGSNSMRGWVARTLGPGNSVTKSGFPSQLGNIKLEANAELRFPIWSILDGALFFDLGNVWLAGKHNNDELSKFRFDSFYKQLGFNTGLGLRFDINVAILRLDWGVRLHDPGQPKGDRWITKFKYSNTVLNFGVGYPF